MKATIAYLPALAALASASPMVSHLTPRQATDIALLEAAPEVIPAEVPIGGGSEIVHYDEQAAIEEALADPSTLGKRGACSPQSVGSGPVPTDGSVAAYLAADSVLATTAVAASAPAGYVQTFAGLQASSSAYGYLGYKTLTEYNPDLCAAQCNKNSKCLGFNIYYERDPLLEPADTCRNPDPTTNIKCTWWGGYIEGPGAKNAGQWRKDFQVVIAGSNGYMKTGYVPTVDGYNGTFIGDYAVNAPKDCHDKNTFMESKVLTSSTYDPKLCKTYCESTNAYLDSTAGASEPKRCKYFVTYMAAKNGSPQGQVCSLYSQSWEVPEYATNDGQWRGTAHYTNGYGFAYSLTSDPGYPTDCPAVPLP